MDLKRRHEANRVVLSSAAKLSEWGGEQLTVWLCRHMELYAGLRELCAFRP